MTCYGKSDEDSHRVLGTPNRCHRLQLVNALFCLAQVPKLQHTNHTYYTHTHNHLTALVRDYLGRPIPEETLTHSHPS